MNATKGTGMNKVFLKVAITCFCMYDLCVHQQSDPNLRYASFGYSKIIYRRLIMIKIANYVDQNTILVYQLVYLPSIKVASNQGEISE